MNTISAGVVQLMQEMQRLAYAAQGEETLGVSSGFRISIPTLPGGEDASPAPHFAELLKASLNQVTGAQTTADTLHTQYEMGASGVDLSDVMIAMQKASLSLQMVQNVRGRLVTAYQDLINTPL